MEHFKTMSKDSVDFTLTDIPYDVVSRESNGLRNLDKGKADVLTFNLLNFLNEVYRVTKTVFVFFAARNNLVTYINFLQKRKEL